MFDINYQKHILTPTNNVGHRIYYICIKCNSPICYDENSDKYHIEGKVIYDDNMYYGWVQSLNYLTCDEIIIKKLLE